MTESICASATWYICSSKRFPLKCNVMERADARLRHPSQETLLSVKILRGAWVNDPLKMFSDWTGHAVDFWVFVFVFFCWWHLHTHYKAPFFVCVFLRQLQYFCTKKSHFHSTCPVITIVWLADMCINYSLPQVLIFKPLSSSFACLLSGRLCILSIHGIDFFRSWISII